MLVFLAILAMLVLLLLLKILKVSTSIIKKVFVNSLYGIIAIFAFNLIGGIFGYKLEANFLNALVVGVFGLPGILVLFLINK